MFSGPETIIYGGCKGIGTDVAVRVGNGVCSGVGETSSNSTDVDGIIVGPDGESTGPACVEADAFATVSGGVGIV